MAAIKKRETVLKLAFWRVFDKLFNQPVPRYLVMNVQDVRTSGNPDSINVGFGRTTFWEFKHATPNFETHRLQEITCQILDTFGFCRYIIFFEYRGVLKTLIARPAAVRGKKGKLDAIPIEHEIEGHDFTALAQFVHTKHTP